VVWNLLLPAGSEGPSLIDQAVTHTGALLGPLRSWRTIVGVAKDAPYSTYNLQEPIDTFVFLPETQSTVFVGSAPTLGEVRSHFLNDVVVRMQPGVKLSDTQVRRAFGTIDPNLPGGSHAKPRRTGIRQF
jgi:hypothetical protein